MGATLEVGSNTFSEPVTLGPFDLAVVGGGLAGLCAALAAAREGARTVLVHDRPVLGGNSSTEIRVPPFGTAEHNPWAYETGIIEELLTEERARSHDRVNYGHTNAVWDLVLYEACRRELSLTLVLNTIVFAVDMAKLRRIGSVTGAQSGTRKLLRISADLFIDATGDGVVGGPAGVPWRVGQEARSEYGESLAPVEGWDWTMGSSLLFRARDIGRPIQFEPPEWAQQYRDEECLQHRDHRFIDGGYWWIEVGYPYDTLAQNEDIRDELLRHLLGVWDHIKNHCTLPGVHERAATYALDWVGMVPAKRETGRFVGAHVMTQNQIQRRELYADRIAYGGWIIDDHTKGGILSREKKPSFDDVAESVCLVAPYSVPLRSLYAEQVENLFLAGRLMSASRVVFNSLRVQRTLAVIGQAAGTAAAFCVHRKVKPAELSRDNVSAIQQSLLRQDCYIPFLRNEDPDDLARGARVTASSQSPWPVEPDSGGLDLASPLAQLVPVTADRIETASLFIDNRAGIPVPLRLTLHPAGDVWDLGGLNSASASEATAVVSPETAGWVEFPLQTSVAPGRLYWLRAEGRAGVLWRMSAVTVPGATAARLHQAGWQFAPRMFCEWHHLLVRVSPETRPFGPENVTSGVSRPESWPNLWISDPEQSFPQWVQLGLPTPARIATLHLALDTDIARSYSQRPPLFSAPHCVRDFRVEAWARGERQVVVEVRGNYHRRRVLGFDPVECEAVCLVVEATNGDPSARIYGIRLYAA